MKKRLTVNIEEKLIEEIKINAIRENKTVGEIIEQLVKKYLEETIIDGKEKK